MSRSVWLARFIFLASKLQYLLACVCFQVSVGGTLWLKSAAYAVRNNSHLYTSDTGLKIHSSSSSSGADVLGQYQSATLQWTVGPSTAVILSTTFRFYAEIEAVVFEQTFPAGLTDSANGDHNDVISAFPSFASQSPDAMLNYLTWSGELSTCKDVFHCRCVTKLILEQICVNFVTMSYFQYV